MRHFAARDSSTRTCLRRGGQPVLGGFAVDQELHASGLLVRRLRALAVALLADQKQQPDMNVFGPQFLGCSNLRDDDALGVARTASVDAVRCLRRRDKRRHRIHVGRKASLASDSRVGCPDVKAGGFDGNTLDVIAKLLEFVGERQAAASIPVVDSMSMSLRVRAKTSIWKDR